MGLSFPNPIDAARRTADTIGDAGRTFVNGAERIGSTVVGGAETVGNVAVRTAQFQADVTRAGLERAWNGAERVGSTVADFTEKAVDAATHPGDPNPPAAQGLKFSETKSASDLAYSANAGEVYRFPDGKEWTVVDVQDDRQTGFRAVALKPNDVSDNRVVVAYAGSSGSLTSPDWQTDFKQAAGLSTEQYRQAVDFAGKWKATDGDNVILTGHSLGGGRAAYASIKTNLPATAVNAAPLALNHLGLNPFDALRITQYYVPGEALSAVNKVNPLDVRPGNGIAVEGSDSILDPRSLGSNHGLANVAPDIAAPEKVR